MDSINIPLPQTVSLRIEELQQSQAQLETHLIEMSSIVNALFWLLVSYPLSYNLYITREDFIYQLIFILLPGIMSLISHDIIDQ